MGGLCSSCCGSSEEVEHLTPDPEILRRQIAEAAERRAHENETRGIKDLGNVKKMQKRAEERDRLESTAGYQQANLKWQV